MTLFFLSFLLSVEPLLPFWFYHSHIRPRCFGCFDISTCPSIVGDGVLRSRLRHRLGEEDQGELSEGGLDSIHLPRGAQGKRALNKKHTQTTLTTAHIHTMQLDTRRADKGALF